MLNAFLLDRSRLAAWMLVFLLFGLRGGGAVAGGISAQWVWPTFETDKPTEKVLTVLRVYKYGESVFEPSIPISAISKARQDYSTPEKAMVSRVSAMMQGDYEWWLSTWEPDSLREVQERNRKMGKGPEQWLQWWRDSFRFVHFSLVRKIISGNFVFITYRMLSKDGKDLGSGIEFPTVFKKIGEKWLVTGELSGDPLVLKSPWVNGEYRIEESE